MPEKAYVPATRYSPQNNTPITNQKEYEQTWLEFNGQKAVQIIKQGRSPYGSATNVTIYTCPSNSYFYLTNIIHSVAVDGAGPSGTGSAVIIGNVSSLRFVSFIENDSARAGKETATQNFSMPLKINPNETIIVSDGNVNSSSSCTIIGFEIPYTP